MKASILISFQPENPLGDVLNEIGQCQACASALPHASNPIVQAGIGARLLIVGQAPGRRVHETGIPWNDPSGDRLRTWLQIEPDVFYDPQRVAIVPMGFCFPGPGRSGDLPPRPECAPLWHARLRSCLPHVRLTLLIGRFAQAYYLGAACRPTLTETVAAYADYLPRYLPLPHPSPRNRAWFKSNPWFEAEVLPALRETVAATLTA